MAYHKFVLIYFPDSSVNLQNVKHYFMGVWRQIGEYLWIVKKDPNAPHTKWIGYMHFINRLSILLFLLAMIIIIVRLIRGG